MYEERFYRSWMQREGLRRFQVVIKESDLFILAEDDLSGEARAALRTARRGIEAEIAACPEFRTALAPLAERPGVTEVVRAMIEASAAWGVGPMAAVAGAVADAVGAKLERRSGTVVVENGGDVRARCPEPLTFAVWAGDASPWKGDLAFEVDAREGIGVCTSSGRVGHSLSFGRADAVVAVGRTAALADAAATAIANRIRKPGDVAVVVEQERRRGRLLGLLACCGERLGVFGNLKLVPPRAHANEKERTCSNRAQY